VLQSIANAQKQGKICCYIDLEHTFEADRAKTLGIDLNMLILAEKCKNAEQALEIIRTLCKEKVVDLIIIDSVQAMSPLNEQENKGKERELASKEIAELARTLSKFFRVVAPDVFNAKASVIMIGQIRIAGIGSFYTHADMTGGEGLKHWAYTRLFIRRGQRTDAPVKKFKNYYFDPDSKLRYETISEDVGFDAVIKLEKTKSSKSSKEGSEIHLPFLYDKGFVNSYNSNEDIEIRIDPESPEPEKEKIKKILIEKEILCGSSEDLLINRSKNITKLDNQEVKKKRGRPKKGKK
jgi:RecA/RadA recombinase